LGGSIFIYAILHLVIREISGSHFALALADNLDSRAMWAFKLHSVRRCRSLSLRPGSVGSNRRMKPRLAAPVSWSAGYLAARLYPPIRPRAAMSPESKFNGVDTPQCLGGMLDFRVL
jgi:hypothetical protein